jgi:glycerophosphoryl diester phosphodiesterase
MNMPTLSLLLGRGSRCKIGRCALALLASSLAGCFPRISMVDIGPLSSAPTTRVVVTAHRGSPTRKALPDNSVAAVRASVEAGIPFIELDVRASNEKELFLFHDGGLHSDNSFAPSSLKGRSVQSLSAAERSSVFLDRKKTASIPLLSEALDALRGSKSSAQLDLKQESDQLAMMVFELLSRRDQIDQALVQIRTPERARLILTSYPRARILGRCKDMKALREFLSLKPEFVELERWASSEAIALAHQAGVAVTANVASSRLDEPSTWNYLRSRGFDGIMSDRAQEHCRDRACLRSR